MQIKKIIKVMGLVVVGLVVLPSMVTGQPVEQQGLSGVSSELSPDIVTWQDCVMEARQYNPDLVSAQEKIVQSRADRNITGSELLPQITSQVSANRSKAAAKKTADTYSYSVTGNQLIFDGFKRVFDVKSAAHTLTAQEYDYGVMSSNVRLNLKVAYTALLRAQQLIGLTQEILQQRKDNLALVQMRYDAGREHKGALLTAQADLAQAEFEVMQAYRNLSVKQQELTRRIGWPHKRLVVVSGFFDESYDSGPDPDFENIVDTTPLIKEMIAKTDAARFSVYSSRADFIPEVYANGSIGKTRSSWPPQDDEWSAGLTLSFPVFEGGSRFAQLTKSKAQLKQAHADQRSTRDSAILTLEETWKDLQDAGDIVSVKREFLAATQERSKIANAQYSTGLISFDDWIIIENNLVDAKKAYLDAQADLLVAQAYWVQAKGGTLEYVQE